MPSKGFRQTLAESKKHLMAYIIIIVILGLSTAGWNNITHPEFELITLLLVSIVGILCITYYFMHDSDVEFHKVAFVAIVCFGIIAAFIVPICDVSDETEHLARAELTSRGDLGKTVDHTPYDTEKINYTDNLVISAFEQNPFYGYLPQALGMIIAKMLDLNVIWLLWLGRIFNLLFYAGVISLAIRKTPILKMPLFFVACLPISIYQAASLSIDSMIIGLGILAVGYFLYMYSAKKDSLETREVIKFSALCLILGLCKLPYMAFIFLVMLVPSANFKKGRKILPYILICIAAIGIAGILWSRYSTPTLLHSWRSSLRFIDSTAQLHYIADHPVFTLKFISQLFTYNFSHIVYGAFNFFGAAQKVHYCDSYHLVVASILAFGGVTLLAYPKNIRFRRKTKIGALLIILMIYIGTGFIQLLTWASVGFLNLGITTRYFVPLFALFPVMISIKSKRLAKIRDSYDGYAMVLTVAFMAVMILSFATKYY